jgi:hypothetical protein
MKLAYFQVGLLCHFISITSNMIMVLEKGLLSIMWGSKRNYVESLTANEKAFEYEKKVNEVSAYQSTT